MRNYNVKLESKVDKKDYYINRVASSVDLHLDKKLTHEISIDCDFETDYNVGLIIGNSGSGKTTFAEKIFTKIPFQSAYDENQTLINSFSKEISYDDRVEILSSIGLNSIPSWLKPIKVLSNGERARAEIALRLHKENFIIIDEFTSVVDRNVAKIMSHCVQKYARKHNKKILLLSVHNDIIEWLNPDWIIDMNQQKYNDRRLLWQNYERKEKLKFEVKECPKNSWKNFSKYHYLSENLPGGKIYTFGLFVNNIQIGFQCFANYTPSYPKILHFNRTVIHPEYSGIGLGIKIINETSEIMTNKNFVIMGKFSHKAIYNSMIKNKNWQFLGVNDNFGKSQFNPGENIKNRKVRRQGVITYGFKYIGKKYVGIKKTK